MPNLALLFYAGLTIVMWGLWGFFGKLALDRGMSPVAIFVAEVTVAFAIAAILVARSSANGFHEPSLRVWNLFGILSGAGLTVGLVSYYFALTRQDASVVVPLTSLYPAVSVLLSYVVLGERLGRLQWAGLVFAIAGAFLLSVPSAGN